MLKKTSGIALNYIRYKETSIIVKIFTRELGLKSYLINGVRSQGKGSKMALYQPLTLLDLVVYDKENAGLQRISEAKLQHASTLIPFDFARTGIALFMAEIIGRSIYDTYQNEGLFDFLRESILILDEGKAPLGHFPLVFLMEKAKYLGFAPEEASGFLTEAPHQPFQADELGSVVQYLEELAAMNYHCTTRIPATLRRKLLDHLISFYSEHQENSNPLKTLAILRQIQN
jgi:DNA repair protein RecO (recombination protein O)